MPTNLPPQYFETEKKLKTAKTPHEKRAILEELLSIVPKHKGTEKLQALLKTKIAKLKQQAEKKHTVGRRGPTFYIDKAGAGQVILVGPPNSGKSQLVKSLTNAEPEVASYPFTTHAPTPAMMNYENIQIQLIDTPPITADHMDVWLTEMIKIADAVLCVLDLSSGHLLENYLTLIQKLEERKIVMASPSQITEAPENLFRKKTLIVGNKIDLPEAEDNLLVFKEIYREAEIISVSASEEINLNILKERIYSLLDILRVYSKIPGKKADRDEPFVFAKGSTLMDMAKAVHKDFAIKLKFARIWNSDKFQGQKVNRDYELQDEDILELHI